MKRETKLRGLENKLRALVPEIMHLRQDVVDQREYIDWLSIYHPDKGRIIQQQKDQAKYQKHLDRAMVKYHKINTERRKLRIIQKSKQLSIL
jgi:hypothetical protein